MNTELVHVEKKELIIDESIFNQLGLENKIVMSPLKELIYGPNGIGKSDFASKSKNPIFLNFEGNVDHIEAHKKKIDKYSEAISMIDKLINLNHNFKTLILDPISKLEDLMIEHLDQTLSSGEKSHGNMYVKFAQEVHGFIGMLDHLRAAKKMNIILIGHPIIKSADNPMTPYYERYELRVKDEKRFGAPFCDWVHCIMFATHDIAFEKKEQIGFRERERVRDNSVRVLYTTPNPAYLAKNTFNLPPKIRLDRAEFTNHVLKFYNKAPGGPVQ